MLVRGSKKLIHFSNKCLEDGNIEKSNKRKSFEHKVRRTHYYTMEVGECDGYARSKVGAHIMEREIEKEIMDAQTFNSECATGICGVRQGHVSRK
jgi:hypothetical protein